MTGWIGFGVIVGVIAGTTIGVLWEIRHAPLIDDPGMYSSRDTPPQAVTWGPPAACTPGRTEYGCGCTRDNGALTPCHVHDRGYWTALEQREGLDTR